MRVVALLSVLAVVGCSDLTRTTEPSRSMKPQSASQQAATVTHEEIDPSPPAVNPCNGEFIVAQARLQFVEHVGNNGGFDHIDYDFNGIGQVTGAEYLGHASFDTFGVSNQGGTTVETSTTRMHVVGKGQAPDFFTDLTFRTVITASGQEHDVEFTNTRCHD